MAVTIHDYWTRFPITTKYLLFGTDGLIFPSHFLWLFLQVARVGDIILCLPTACSSQVSPRRTDCLVEAVRAQPRLGGEGGPVSPPPGSEAWLK